MLLLCVESDLIVLGLSLRQTSLSRGGRRELPDGPTKTPGLSFCLLHDLLCIYLPALLSVCLTANLCQPVLSIWPTLSCITNNHCHPTLPFPCRHRSPISPSLLLKHLSSNFTAHYFFMSSEEQKFLALLHSTDPQGRRSQPRGGPGRGCLLSCYLSPS